MRELTIDYVIALVSNLIGIHLHHVRCTVHAELCSGRITAEQDTAVCAAINKAFDTVVEAIQRCETQEELELELLHFEAAVSALIHENLLGQF